MSLPRLTISYAHHAKTLGGFGLVTLPLTIAYHRSDLSLPPFLRPLPSPPPPRRGHTQTHVSRRRVASIRHGFTLNTVEGTQIESTRWHGRSGLKKNFMVAYKTHAWW